MDVKLTKSDLQYLIELLSCKSVAYVPDYTEISLYNKLKSFLNCEKQEYNLKIEDENSKSLNVTINNKKYKALNVETIDSIIEALKVNTCDGCDEGTNDDWIDCDNNNTCHNALCEKAYNLLKKDIFITKGGWS